MYPLVNVYITNWKITIFHGKTHYFDWAIFNSYVKLPEGKFKRLLRQRTPGQMRNVQNRKCRLFILVVFYRDFHNGL